MYCPNPDCPDRRQGGAPAEYREGTDRCPYCGELLAPPEDEAPDGPTGGPLPAAEATHHEVTVFVAGDPAEAAMIVGLLEENGIACLRRVEGLGGETAFFSARWAPVPGQKYEIVVSSAAEEAARRLLEETFGPQVKIPERPPTGPSASLERSREPGERPSEGSWRPLVVLLLLGAMFIGGVVLTLLHLLGE